MILRMNFCMLVLYCLKLLAKLGTTDMVALEAKYGTAQAQRRTRAQVSICLH